jgi:hypothetical protein
LACGNVLRRLAARAACAVAADDLRVGVGLDQYGVGRRAGCELIHKCITALTDQDASRTVVAFDCTNAFNSLPRNRVRDAVLGRVPLLATTVAEWLSRPVFHLFWDSDGACHSVPATSGVDQGCPLSPALFALGIADSLEAIRVRLRGLHEGAHVFAYLDDIIIVVPREIAAQAYDVVCEELERAGLAVNAGKTKVWSREGTQGLPASLTSKSCAHLTVLGAAVPFLAREESYIPVHGQVDGSEQVRRSCELRRRLAALRKSGLSYKSAYTILQAYSQGCITHIQRAHYDTGEWLGHLDDTVKGTLEDILGGTLDTGQQDQATARYNSGGTGLSSARQRAAHAYCGSWALTMSQVAQVIGAESCEGFWAQCPDVAETVQRAERELRVSGGNEGKPINWVDCFNQEHLKRQGEWHRQSGDHKVEAMLPTLDNPGQAVVRAHGGPGAGSFLQPTPEDVEAMPNAHFQVVLRRRLRL